jgi:hypothetical protein
MMLGEIKVASSSDTSRVYTITVEKNPDRVSCTCTGCMVHGYCKHIRFYKKAIKKLLEKGNGG